jgi:hypothetical protein
MYYILFIFFNLSLNCSKNFTKKDTDRANNQSSIIIEIELTKEELFKIIDEKNILDPNVIKNDNIYQKHLKESLEYVDKKNNILTCVNNYKKEFDNFSQSLISSSLYDNPDSQAFEKTLEKISKDTLLPENEKQSLIDYYLHYICTIMSNQSVRFKKIEKIINILLDKKGNIHKIDQKTKTTAFIDTILQDKRDLIDLFLAKDNYPNIDEYLIGLIIARIKRCNVIHDNILTLIDDNRKKKYSNYKDKYGYFLTFLHEYLIKAFEILDYYTADRLIDLSNSIYGDFFDKQAILDIKILGENDSNEDVKKKIEKILSYDGVDINFSTNEKNSFLVNYLILKDNPEIIHFLIEKGSDVNTKGRIILGSQKMSCLQIACTLKRIESIKKIIPHIITTDDNSTISNAFKALINYSDELNDTEFIELLKLFISKGLNINENNNNTLNYLERAIQQEKFKWAKVIADQMTSILPSRELIDHLYNYKYDYSLINKINNYLNNNKYNEEQKEDLREILNIINTKIID